MSRQLSQPEVKCAQEAGHLVLDAVEQFRRIANPTLFDVGQLAATLAVQSYDLRILTMDFAERIEARKHRPPVATGIQESRGSGQGQLLKKRAEDAQQSWIADWEQQHEG